MDFGLDKRMKKCGAWVILSKIASLYLTWLISKSYSFLYQ